MVVTRSGSNTLDVLFSSRVRVRILAIFLLNPGSEFHARALTKAVGAHYNAVWKELAKLERIGLLVGENSSTIKSYGLNPDFPLLPELTAMILKTVGVGDVIRQTLAGFGELEAAFIFGSFASGDSDSASDIDLIVVGSVDLTRFAQVIAKLERELSREVNYIAYSGAEWSDKIKKRDPFVANVLEAPKIMIIGSEDALRAIDSTKKDQTLRRASGRDQPPVKLGSARSRHRRAKPSRGS